MTPSIDHLSYSSIDLFLNCPEAWRRKYIAKEPTIVTPALAFGSAWHGTIEQYITPGNTISAADLWSKNWAKHSEQKIFWGAESPEQNYNEGLRLLNSKAITEGIISIKPGVDGHGPIIERKVELRVPGVPVPVIGFIDVILADGTPADIKTSKASWSEAKASDSLQSLFYLAALNQAGMKINWKFQHLIFVKTKEPKFQTLEHYHKSSELFFLFELIKRVWTAIEYESFTLNPTTWLCNSNYCDFYANCRGRYG